MATFAATPTTWFDVSPRLTWQQTTAALTAQFTVWRGQALRITEHTGRRLTRTKAGWIDYVTAMGFGFAWTAPGAWQQDAPVTLRQFVSWTDLWASQRRVLCEGTMTDDNGGLATDLADWVAAWGEATIERLPLRNVEPFLDSSAIDEDCVEEVEKVEEDQETPPHDTDTEEGDTADDGLKTTAHGSRSGGLNRSTRRAQTTRAAAGRPVSVS